MADKRYFNPYQPQTLQIAVMLLYIGAAFEVLGMLIDSALYWFQPVSIALGVAGAYGIANERKWGYGLGLAAAIFPFVLRLYYLGSPFRTGLIQLMIEVALVALLVHPQSREYQRIWFK